MKILITLGGTGGHIYPAQDLACLLKAKGHEVYFAGDKGLFFSLTDIPYIPIVSGNIRKKKLSIFSLMRGIVQSLILYKKVSFDVVIGMGSFHSVPILLAARLVRKKIVLFEPNIVCGLANRIFSRSSHFIVTQFPTLEKHYAKRVYQTRFLPWNKPNIEPTKKRHFTLMIFGGSQGAEVFNQMMPKVMQRLKQLIPTFELIHITGKKACIESIQEKYSSLKVACTIKLYDPHLLSSLSRCDLAICRCGAGTIGDLMTSHTPAIVIPYPYATDRHQEKNGFYFANTVKGGVLIKQEESNEKTIFGILRKILAKDRAELKKYRENIIRFYEKNQQSVSMVELVEGIQ